jgi:hypothetical protein
MTRVFFFVPPRKITRLDSLQAAASVPLHIHNHRIHRRSDNQRKNHQLCYTMGIQSGNGSNDITVFSFCFACPDAHITLSICSLLAVFHLSRAITHTISVRLPIFSCAHCTVLLNYEFAILTEV